MHRLTPEQADAIRAYAAQHGKRWKDCLLSDWMRAGSSTYRGSWCYLQQIRNQHGPAWLRAVQLDDQTDQGAQVVLPGAEKISERAAIERQMSGRAQARKPQKRFESTELFAGLPPKQDELF